MNIDDVSNTLYVKYLDVDSQYLLMLSKIALPNSRAYSEVSFLIPHKTKYEKAYVTGRNNQETDKLIPYENRTDLQIVDIGCGLHEFAPNIALKQAKLGPKGGPLPIVIDMFNYALASQMMEYAINNSSDVDEKIIEKINVLNERSKIITNEKLVKLYNISFEEALKLDELHGVADLVVNCYANISNASIFGKSDATIIKY